MSADYQSKAEPFLAARDLRCRRCNAPHAFNPESNKNGGGVGHILPWAGDLCPVCERRRQRYERKAQPHLLARRLREGKTDTTETNATLGEFGGEA